MKKLLDLFAGSWQAFWSKLKAQRTSWKAPRGCTLQGFLVGIRRRRRDRDGKIERGELITSESEELGENYARKTRQPTRPVNAIPVWRRAWTAADRKPWVRARPYAQA